MPETVLTTEACNACGSEVRDESLFCYNCGERVRDGDPTAEAKTTVDKIETGIVMITIRLLRKSFKNNRTIRPVKMAPRAPSVIRLFTAFITNTDWSKA